MDQALTDQTEQLVTRRLLDHMSQYMAVVEEANQIPQATAVEAGVELQV